jgi:cellulose synthase/poly-beta-1,6-N-acetylglucosamine synthase-like glycosyltransferase
MTTNDWWGVAITTFNFVIFGYFVVVNTTYLALFGAAFVSARRYMYRQRAVDLQEVFRSPLTPPISVIVPAYNEEASIVEVVRAALVLRYPRFEVLVVNDGSSDSTLQSLIDAYDLKIVAKAVERKVPCQDIAGVYISSVHDNLVVMDKAHGGKADSLNAGINVSRGDILCMVDADSLIEPDALLKVARPFLDSPEETVAVGGVIRVVNGCDVSGGRVTRVKLPRGFFANVQIIEYLRAFLGGRMGWASIQSLLIVPGAFGAFDRNTVIEIGGYRRDTVGVDMEIILRMHTYLRKQHRKYRIWYIPDPVCWTEVPVHWRQVARQRDRWQRGLLESLRAHEDMLFNPRYGLLGLFATPFYFFLEMLGPVVELGGYVMIVLAYLLGLLNIDFLYLFLAVAILYGVVVSLLGIALQGVVLRHYPRLPSLLKMGLFAVLDNLGYRQVNSWWRTKAYVTFYTRRDRWGTMERTGYTKTGQQG